MTRLRRALAILGLVIAAAAVAGVLWRHALVEEAARRLLAANSLGEARLDVISVGTDAIVIEDLALGPGLPEIRRLRFVYAPGELISGRLRSLRIEGLRHDVPGGLEATLEPLEPLMPGDGAGGWLVLPRVEIEDAVLSLSQPLSGTVTIDGALDLTGDSPGAALDVALDIGGGSAAFTFRSDALGEGGLVEIDGGGEIGLAGAKLPATILPAALLPAGQPATLSAGRARFTLAGEIRLPSADAGLEFLRTEKAASLRGELAISGVNGPATDATLAADIAFALEAGEGTVRLGLPRPVFVSARGIPPGTLAALGLASPDGAPRDLTAEIASPQALAAWTPGPEGGQAELAADLSLALGEATAAVRASVGLHHDAGFRLSAPATLSAEVEAAGLDLARPDLAATLRSASWSASGSVTPDGEVTLEGPLAAEAAEILIPAVRSGPLRVEGAVRLSAGPGRWSLDGPSGVTLTAEDAGVPGRLTFSGPLALTLRTLALDSRDGTTEIALSGTVEPVSGTLQSGGEEVFVFADASGGFGLSAAIAEDLNGEVTLEGADLSLPDHGVRLSGLAGRWPLAAAEAPLALSAELRDTAPAARFPPLDVTLEGRRSADALTFSGEATARGDALRLPLDGRADLAAMTGRMSVGPSRLAFRPGGLQPGALSALLPALDAVDGAVDISADLSLDADGALRSTAALDFQALSARSGALAVTGLSGRVRLSRLAPLATAGVQELTARSVTAGVPVDGVRARFSAEARRNGTLLRLPEATGALAGGTLRVEDATWDTGARSNAVEVRVSGVELARLLSDWHIEGLSGTGRLSGVIPVTLAPAGVAIAGGRLDAAGPGVIQVDWGSARETLVNSGEQVALTVRALEDFHYDTLSIGVDQPAGGELSLAVSLEGANPEVLDGHPFRFNVNLGGRLGPILEAVREGERIGTELLRGGLGGQ